MARTPEWLKGRLAVLPDTPERDALIFAALTDPDPAMREVAVAWAARCLEPDSLFRFVADHRDATIRNAAIAALERQGPYAAAVVARQTADPDPDLAMFACQVLGRIGGAESVEPLLAALDSPVDNVVQAAAESLGQVGSPAAVVPLVALLAREPWLQLPALDALGAIADAGAVPAILRLVPDSFVARPALEALRRISAPQTIEPLARLLATGVSAELRSPVLVALAAPLERMAPLPDLPEIRQAIGESAEPGGLGHFLLASLETAAAESPNGDDRAWRREGSAMARAAATVILAAGAKALFRAVLRRTRERETADWLVPLLSRAPALLAERDSLLEDPDAVVRTAIVTVIGVVGPSALETGRLRALLEDTDADVRLRAAAALAQRGEARAIPTLREWLGSDDRRHRDVAMAGLVHFPARLLEPVLGQLLDDHVPTMERVAALTVLARVPCPRLEDPILALCASVEPSLRRAAYCAAAALPGSRAEVALLRGLADRVPALQVAALDLLVRHGGERIAATLRALLASDDSLRYHVIRALGRLRAADAVGALVALFPHAARHEQVEIVTALSQIGTPPSKAFLVECLRHSQDEIRRAGAQGVALQAGPEDVELLRQLARDGDWVLRSEAAHGLARIGGAAARPVLLDLARDVEPAVARAGRAALAPLT